MSNGGRVKIRELMRKVKAVKPARVPVGEGGVTDPVTDARGLERTGIRTSEWAADQERPR